MSLSSRRSNRFSKTHSGMVEKFEVEKRPPTRNVFKDSRKKLTNHLTGVGYIIEPGLSWRKIALEVLNDGTHSSNLIKVARGEIKSTNGWEVEILD